MAKNPNKTIDKEKFNPRISYEEEFIFSNTAEVIKKPFDGDISEPNVFLDVIGLEENVRRIGLREDRIIIGRIPECEIQFPVKSISRKHACIYFHNEEYFIEDLNSTNGIYINGLKIEKASLRNQDQIEVGEIIMIFSEYSDIL